MLYFAYGSNLYPKEMHSKRKCPNAKGIAIAYLEGYTLIFPRKSVKWEGGVASIGEKIGARVWGVIYEITDEKEISQLDKAEGYHGLENKNNAYNRVDIIVVKKDDLKVSVEIYIAASNKEENSSLLPSKEYLGTIIKGAKHWRLPKEYISLLENWGHTK